MAQPAHSTPHTRPPVIIPGLGALRLPCGRSDFILEKPCVSILLQFQTAARAVWHKAPMPAVAQSAPPAQAQSCPLIFLAEGIPAALENLAKYAPVVAILLLILWAGHKGFWFWGPGVRAMLGQLERERDEWKKIALAMLRKNGIYLPESTDPATVAQLVKPGVSLPGPEPDR